MFDLTDDFVGDWVSVAGKRSPVCSDGLHDDSDLSSGKEQLHITRGTQSGLVLQFNDWSDCPLAVDVAGDVATARRGQSCRHMQTSSQGLPLVVTLTFDQVAFSFGLDSSLMMLHENEHGGSVDDGSSVTCSWGQVGQFQRK